MILLRYLLGLVTTTLLGAVLVLIGAIWIMQALRLGHYLLGAGSGTLFHLLGYSLPTLIVFSLPIALFFACIFVFVRLGETGQLDAMSSVGWSPWQLALPFILVGGLGAGLTFSLATFCEPPALAQLQRTLARCAARALLHNLAERRFFALSEGTTLHVQKIQPQAHPDRLHIQGLFLAQQDPAQLIMARQGVVQLNPQLQATLSLSNGEIQALNGEGGLRRVRFASLSLTLDLTASLRPLIRFLDQHRATSFRPLLSSLSCLALALWAVVLGARRWSRWSLVVFSLLLVVFFQLGLWGLAVLCPGVGAQVLWIAGAVALGVLAL